MTDVPENAERTTSASPDLVTAFASEVVWQGDAYARANRGVIFGLIESNRQAAANATAEDIALTLTQQATLVERMAAHFAMRAVAASDPHASATLAKTALSAVRTLVQIKSAQYQMMKDRHGDDS
jgi:hypothetical protein